MHDVTTAGLEALAEERFVIGTTAQVLGEDLTALDDWCGFQAIFEDLPPDAYMNDGGSYRLRRFGRFVYTHEGDRLEVQPHAPYSQPKYFNPLNGGVDRHFAPLTDAIVNNQVLQRVLKLLGAAYSALEDQPRWRINTYFNRIVAKSAEDGKPVPEGKHRDGVKFSCLFMANHINFTGGDTTLFDLLTHDAAFEGRLSAGGDILVFRDDTVLHDTTAIQPADLAKPGYRDVLVIEFR
ncbi:2OG-Fe dioxygenase family protein [Ramlibacter sp.]|uniref:2OG-Fe dioxygenase family protein n=1 Tax=Ramlibacter sp. TaxID=1917967 RepID=UPI0017D3A135|nr:2OG-Fe dioxygenase family protein [Ramlibacter sp.]MBA2673726.1 2OG-Fe dioxygenase family protein [Ramlibacter sp.]